MIHRKILLLFVLLTFAAHFLNAQTSQNVTREKLVSTVDSILQSQVNQKLIPGAVVEIKKDNKVLLKKAFGYAERNDFNNQPLLHPVRMTTDDMFDLASLTKVVGTTTAIMLLVDRGKIKVDDPVGKYIPAFNEGEKKKNYFEKFAHAHCRVDRMVPVVLSGFQ